MSDQPSPPAFARPSTVRKAFRVLAAAEAVSWIGLLIGMYFKWIAQTSELGVEIFGPIHGGVFIAYCLATVAAAWTFRWSWMTTLVGLASSLPPLATLPFERWAERKSLLQLRSSAPVTG